MYIIIIIIILYMYVCIINGKIIMIIIRAIIEIKVILKFIKTK